MRMNSGAPSLGGGQAFEHEDGVVRRDGAVHFDGRSLLGELVGDIEQFEGLAVGGLVEREVDGPDMTRADGPEPGAVDD